MVSSTAFDSLTPIVLVDHGSAGYSVVYCPGGFESDDYATVFSRHELDGTGHNYAGALRAMMTDENPAELDQVGFDPEAGMLAVFSKNLDALYAAAQVLFRLVHDSNDFDKALTRAEELGFTA